MDWTIAVDGHDVPVALDDGSGGPVVVLAHGAGSHMNHGTVMRLTGLLQEQGCRVCRFNFLYRSLGKSIPDRMPLLMRTYRAVLDSVRSRSAPSKLLIGGHSMGGRVASMLASEGDAIDGLILFGYPLHPPGQPDKRRDAHLPDIHQATLQLNGTRDDLCDPELMAATQSRLGPNWKLAWIQEADHSYAVKKASGRSKADVDNDIRLALRSWLDALP